MQPPEDENLAPRVWMEFAWEDIKTARLALPAGLTRSTCFHAQQAAEKAIKAYLAALSDDDIPRTHDLLLLSALVLERGGEAPPGQGLRELNQHAVMTRYPVAEAPTEAEAAEALQLAEGMMRFARGALDELAEAARQWKTEEGTTSGAAAATEPDGEAKAPVPQPTDEDER